MKPADARSASVPVFDVSEGSLTAHAAALPAEAPITRTQEIEEIAAGEKRARSLAALIPVFGLWRVWRSSLHSQGEKIVLGLVSLLVTAAAAYGLWTAIPGAEERSAEVRQKVEQQIQVLGQLVGGYRADQGSWPDSEAWRRSAEMADPRFYDPWGRIYEYALEGGKFTIGTYGRDGRPGGGREDADVFVTFDGAGEGARAITRPAAAVPRHVILDSGSRACPTVEIGGTVELHGTLQVNGSCAAGAAALRVGESASLAVASGVSVVGTAVAAPGGILKPEPISGVAPVVDPLARLAAPRFNGSTFTTPQNPGGLPPMSGTAAEPATLVIDDVRSLTPGVYWGGIRILSGARVTMAPGEYVMAGGGLTVLGDAILDGDAVVVYNTLDPANPAGVGGYDQIYLAGTATVSLTAPASGEYAGIVLFQDRSNPRALFLGGTGLDVSGLDGVIYAANAGLVVGGSAKTLKANLVVGRLTTQSSLTILPPSYTPSREKTARTTSFRGLPGAA